ncbi:hypothetical protein CHU98_g11486, partial [Xylaria longipes]
MASSINDTADAPDATGGNGTEDMRQLFNILHSSRRIIAIVGAGISVAAGCKDIFDARWVFETKDNVQQFARTMEDLRIQSVTATPTAFHHLLQFLAQDNRLLRLYTQNIDGLEVALPGLETATPLRRDKHKNWPQTIQLHGSIHYLTCQRCHSSTRVDDKGYEIQHGNLPLCTSARCSTQPKTKKVLRHREPGTLIPRVSLYNQTSYDSEEIIEVMDDDIKSGFNAVIIAGTSLKLDAIQKIVRRFVQQKQTLIVWIGPDPPPSSFHKCFRYIVQAKAEDVALEVNVAPTLCLLSGPEANAAKSLIAIYRKPKATEKEVQDTEAKARNAIKEAEARPKNTSIQTPEDNTAASANQDLLKSLVQSNTKLIKSHKKLVSKVQSYETTSRIVIKGFQQSQKMLKLLRKEVRDLRKEIKQTKEQDEQDKEDEQDVVQLTLVEGEFLTLQDAAVAAAALAGSAGNNGNNSEETTGLELLLDGGLDLALGGKAGSLLPLDG